MPSAPPQDVGIDRGLVGAYGQDDRLSSYCAARAVLDLSGTPKKTALAYLSNFEEEGSVNNTGAASQFYNNALAKLVAAERAGKYTDLDLREALRRVGGHLRRRQRRHQPHLHEPDERGHERGAPGLRRDDQEVRRGLRRQLRVHRAASAASSTRAASPGRPRRRRWRGIPAARSAASSPRWDMEVIDIGVPLLSMHSPFEMSSKVDVWSFYRLMSAFYGS